MPSPSDVHVDAPLTNLAVAYEFPECVADQCMPPVMVKKETDLYYKFAREELKTANLLRGVGAPSAELKWDVSTSSYIAQAYALKFLLPDRVRDNADSVIQPRISAVEKLTRALLLQQEIRVAAIVQSATLFSGKTSSPSTKWDASSGADPEASFDAAVPLIRRSSGMNPNSFITNDQTARAIRRYLSTKAGGLQLTDKINFIDLPPKVFGCKPIIGRAVYDTAREGQTASISDVYTDSCLICYINPSPALHSISMGYQLKVQDFVVKSWREEQREGEYIEAQHIQDEVLVAADAGYLYTDCLT